MQFDANGWLDAAQEIDYSANSMSRQGYGIKYLCLHGTAGGSSAQGIGTFFQGTVNSNNPVSSHIIIDQQGNIVQGIPLSLAAFGNGVITNGHAAWLPDPSINPNWYTASIEFVKSATDNSNALTAIQQQVGFEVIQCICDTYDIPKRAGDANGGIISHADIDPINRARCPGTLDWTALFNFLSGNEEETMSIDINTPGVSQFFKASVGDKTWLCTNGKIVGGAILDFYKSFGGSGLCGLTFLGIPLTSEIGVAGHAGVTVQEFERGALRYDPSKALDNPPGSGSVYLIHVEQDPRAIATQAQIATQQKQITALQAQVAALQPEAAAAELATLQAKLAQVVKEMESIIN